MNKKEAQKLKYYDVVEFKSTKYYVVELRAYYPNRNWKKPHFTVTLSNPSEGSICGVPVKEVKFIRNYLFD